MYSLSRAVVTFAALSSDENASMLKAVGDRLHEPYRKPLIKGYDEVEAAFMATGAVSCCISGAGTSAAKNANPCSRAAGRYAIPS